VWEEWAQRPGSGFAAPILNRAREQTRVQSISSPDAASVAAKLQQRREKETLTNRTRGRSNLSVHSEFHPLQKAWEEVWRRREGIKSAYREKATYCGRNLNPAGLKGEGGLGGGYLVP